MRTALVSALLALTGAHAVAGESSYYLDLVNASPDSLQALAIAPSGSNQFIAVTLAGEPLRGGGESATVRIRSDAENCLRDIRMTFVTGQTLVQRDFNVCHRQRLTIKRSKTDSTLATPLLTGR